MVCAGKRVGLCCRFGDFGCAFTMWEWFWLGCFCWVLGIFVGKCGVHKEG